MIIQRCFAHHESIYSVLLVKKMLSVEIKRCVAIPFEIDLKLSIMEELSCCLKGRSDISFLINLEFESLSNKLILQCNGIYQFNWEKFSLYYCHHKATRRYHHR